jgi:hypothetical protein
MKRLPLAAVTAILVSALLGSSESRADSPTCFPERTVLWAATFVDEHGNAFGGIRAGHLVRIREDFVGPNGDQALVDIDDPVHVRAMVPRRVLVAFTRQELEPKVGFSRWVAGAPVTVGKLEDGLPRLFLADPHDRPKESPSIPSPCSSILGSPVKILYRDWCHGAWPATSATTHGDRRVFWKKATPLKSSTGPDVITIGAGEWVFLVDRGKYQSVIELRDWLRHTIYTGHAPTKGMHYVPSELRQGSDHLCCEGALLFRPDVRVSEGREAVVVSSASIRTADSEAVAILNKGFQVRVLREQDHMAFVAYRWPTWDSKEFTFQLHGWIDKKALGETASSAHPPDAGTRDAVEQAVAADGAAPRR